MTTGNTNTSAAQIVDHVLEELIAGALEFDPGSLRLQPPHPSETRSDGNHPVREYIGAPALSAALSEGQ
jgi:hypothetical protein